VFINNAYAEFGQQCLLYELWENWKNKDKIIVNIGSRAADYVHDSNYPHYRYSIQKQALESASMYMTHCMMPCKVICVKPGYVDTAGVRNKSGIKMDPKELASEIQRIIDHKNSTFWTPVITLYPR
jgi:NAD(P)-dependent dehydrogenase (short-subunit alcohol dehydrogenase family)